MIDILTVFALAVGFVLGYFSKGITIKISQPEPQIKTDEQGKPMYNESLLDLLSPSVRQEIDELNRR